MAAPTDPAKLDHAIKLYKSGKTLRESATTAGISETTLNRKLRILGQLEDRAQRPTPTPPALAADYLSGESVKALALRHGVNRTAIARMLGELGIDTRDRSMAMTIRWQRATLGQRESMLADAHEAAKRPHSVEQRIRIASAKAGRPLSGEEVELADCLRELGHSVELGVPCGVYNLDLVVSGTVAVEVFGGNWHGRGRHRERFPERCRHILDAGYSLAIVWTHHARYPLSVACAKHLDTLVQITGGHPAIGRQHWVIRGDGYFLAVREDDGDQVPFISPSGSRDH